MVAVLTVVAEADMHPVGALQIVFPNELVELQVGLDVVEPLLAFRHVAVDAEVGSLAEHVLRVLNTTDGCIELQATEPTPYLHLSPPPVAQWLQHIMAERSQVDDFLCVGLVLDAFRLGCGRGTKLVECEVFTESDHGFSRCLFLLLYCRG